MFPAASSCVLSPPRRQLMAPLQEADRISRCEGGPYPCGYAPRVLLVSCVRAVPCPSERSVPLPLRRRGGHAGADPGGGGRAHPGGGGGSPARWHTHGAGSAGEAAGGRHAAADAAFQAACLRGAAGAGVPHCRRGVHAKTTVWPSWPIQPTRFPTARARLWRARGFFRDGPEVFTPSAKC